MENEHVGFIKIQINYKSGNSYVGWFHSFNIENGRYKLMAAIPPDTYEEIYRKLNYKMFKNMNYHEKLELRNLFTHDTSDILILGADEIESVIQIGSCVLKKIPDHLLNGFEEFDNNLNIVNME